MNTHIRSKTLLTGATLLGTVLFAVPSARTADIVQTVDQTAGQNWNVTPSWGGPPPEVAAPGNNYFTPAGLHVRTVDGTNAQAFVGDSLTIEAGGTLWLKHVINAATVNLVLNGGEIEFHGSSAIAPSPLAGTIHVLVESFLGSDQGPAQASDIWLQSDITGSGNLAVNITNGGSATNGVIVTGDNSGYSGNWITSAGYIVVGSGTANPLGSGGVNLGAAAHELRFNATNDVTITNLIEGQGSLVKLNTNNTVTLGGDNPYFYGTVRVIEGVLRIQDATAIASAQLSLEGGTLDATPLGGLVLNDTIAQTLRGRGTVLGGLEARSGTTLNFNLTALTNDILNVNGGSLTLTGSPTLSLDLVGFKQPGTYRLINYSGTIQGGGSFFLLPPAGSSQTFTLDTSTPGQVNLTITGDPRDLLWVGNGFDNYWSAEAFDVNWTDGGVPTSFAQGDHVTFDDSGSDTPDIVVYSGLTPTLFTVGNMTISNSTKAYTFTLDGITSTRALIKRGTNRVAFANNGNAFSGPITIEEGILSIGNGGAEGSLGNGDIVNNGVLMMNKSANGAILNGTISGTGDVISTGGGTSLELGGTNTYTGLTTASDSTEIIIRNNESLGSPSTGTIVTNGGSVRIVSLGNYTIAEPLTLSGPGPEFPGALYVNTAGNVVTWTGPITIAGSEETRIRLVNDNVRLTLANTVTGTDTPLRCSTEGTGEVLTFGDVLDIGAGVLTKDGVGTLVLAATGNIAGNTTLNGGTLLVNGDLNGGPTTVNSTTTLGGTGTVLGSVSVASNGALAPGSGGIGTLTLNSTLANAGAYVMQVNSTNAQTSDVLVAANIPLGSSTLNVVNTGPALQPGDSFDLFDGTISGPVPTVVTTGNGFAQVNYVWDTSQLLSSGVITVALNPLPLLPLETTEINLQSTTLGLTWNSYPSLLYTIEYSFALFTWAVARADVPADGVTNSTTALLDTAAPASSPGVTLAQYQMGTPNAQIQDAGNLVAAGPLTGGAGLVGGLFNTAAAPGPAYASAPVLQVNYGIAGTIDLATAMANQSWFTFALTVGTNVTDLDLTSLTFNAARGGGATQRGYGAYVILPDLSEVQLRAETLIVSQRPTWSPQSIDLTGVPGLQNLTAGQVITFKIAHFSPATSNSCEYDDITVKGDVSPGFPPPFAGADQLFLRIKQQ